MDEVTKVPRRRTAAGGATQRATAVVVGLVVAGIAAFPAAGAGQPTPPQGRPRIGVALGGGSARGIAHVGVLRWLEEHRIPIDVLAGTSMGGLVGGSYATGMTPDELQTMLGGIDWDEMFGASEFAFANVRRKRDFRDYPSRIEFGLRRGLALPPALNSGQQVDLLLARLTAPYHTVATFDDLPTPFRCVAVDLRSATAVVLDRGSLAEAMRATMSLPLVFPPVNSGTRVLVDGGAMNNIPADVVRQMGADRVIAVNVGDLKDPEDLSTSLLGVAGNTIDAMMRANTLKALTSADVVINVPLEEYGSLDWRRYRELIDEGYRAAEAMQAALLPFAVSEALWERWRAARAAARKTSLPTPTFVQIEGAASADTALMQRTLSAHVGRPLDLDGLEADVMELGGLDRYETLRWEIVARDGTQGLLVRAAPKPYGPPFLHLAVSLENTTSDDFHFGLAGRYVAFDLLGSGSELRVDGNAGSTPSAAFAFYRPLGSTPFFVEPVAGVRAHTLNYVEEDRIVAAYRQTRTVVGADAGINLGRLNEVRAGVRFGRLDATVRVGDPGLPELGGKEATLHLLWTHDSQDSPVVPSRGLYARSRLQHFLDSPEPPAEFASTRTSSGVTQLEASASRFWALDADLRRRVFAAGGFGTSFDGQPLATEQFWLGGPFRLGAFPLGEQRGDHYALATGGYLHQAFRLPDLVGGPLFLGGWLETGSAFDRAADAEVAVHTSVGLIAETLIGPVFAAVSLGFDGESRYYLGIGRVFR